RHFPIRLCGERLMIERVRSERYAVASRVSTHELHVDERLPVPGLADARGGPGAVDERHRLVARPSTKTVVEPGFGVRSGFGPKIDRLPIDLEASAGRLAEQRGKLGEPEAAPFAEESRDQIDRDR